MDILKYFGISIEGGLEYSGISTDLWNFCEGYGVLWHLYRFVIFSNKKRKEW